MEIGYTLSSEEFEAPQLGRFAQRAEQAGVTFALTSDHFHPWIDKQGHSPFVWSVIGGVAMATKKLRLGTGVTCPLMRIHPAIIVQAAATAASMMPVRRLIVLNRNRRLAGVLSLGDVALTEGAEPLAGDTMKETADPAA